MKIYSLFILAATLAIACTLPSAAQAPQERGYWHAASNTASSITGDIAISDAKLTIDFRAYSLARIRDLKPAEVASVFDEDVNTAGNGSLYRLMVPAETRFLHKNTLCGTDETQWMATYLSGKTLQAVFFSGEDAPTFTVDAISNSQRVCGTYTFVR